MRSNHPLGLGRLERVMVYNNDMLLKFKADGKLDVHLCISTTWYTSSRGGSQDHRFGFLRISEHLYI
jgi:hypothetical protein